MTATSAERPSGGIRIQLFMFGQPRSTVSFAIVNDESAIVESVSATGTTSLSVSGVDGSGGTLEGEIVDGQCRVAPSISGRQQSERLHRSQIIRGTAQFDQSGQASVQVIGEGDAKWFQAGGGRSDISLPVFQSGLFSSCGIGSGDLSGTWTRPQLFKLTATVPADSEIGAEVSAKPDLLELDDQFGVDKNELTWAVNQDASPTSSPAAGKDATGVFLWPRYTIQTMETTRLGTASLFGSGLLAAAALTAVFEIVTTWPGPAPSQSRAAVLARARRSRPNHAVSSFKGLHRSTRPKRDS